MNNFVTSIIRTYVPIVVGAVVAWLVAHNINIDPDTQAGAIIALTGMLQAVYYYVVRLLERRYPQMGWLLGQASKPDYK